MSENFTIHQFDHSITNFTNQSSDGSNILSTFTRTLVYIEYASRIFGLVSHLWYFLMVASIKELRAFSMIYMHQVNFFGLLFVLHFVVYIGSSRPSFSDPYLNAVLCTMSELLWSALKFLRSLSILLLALFRTIAVLKGKLFRQWIESRFFMILFPVLNIFISIAMVVLAKFFFATTYGPILCYDGYSDADPFPTFKYLMMTSIVGTVLPSVLTFIFYLMITKHLRSIRCKVSTSSKETPPSALGPGLARLSFIPNIMKSLSIPTVLTMDSGSANNSKNKGSICSKQSQARPSQKTLMAKQFLYITICFILSSVTFTLLNVFNLFPSFATSLYMYRLLARISSTFSQGLVPIVSLYWNQYLVLSAIQRRFKNFFTLKYCF